MQAKSYGRCSVVGATPRAAGRATRGFTLVEMMITLAVGAVLMVIAIPSFRTMVLSNKLTSTANDIVTALNVAKMEAIKGNNYTTYCSDSASVNTSDTLGTKCGGTNGGAVFLQSGTTVTQIRAPVVGIASPIQVSSSMQAVRFAGEGLGMGVGSTSPLTTTIADICTSSLSTNNHRVVSMSAGSVIVTCTVTATCPSTTVGTCK
jgi:type IV fimbrial biogenesis protein FimT